MKKVELSSPGFSAAVKRAFLVENNISTEESDDVCVNFRLSNTK